MLKPKETDLDADNSVAYHDQIAETWDARYQRGGFARRAAFIAREIVPQLPKGGRWLDAGCGSGFFSRMLASDGRDVVGVDASARMISAALKNSPTDLATFEHIDTIERLPFEDEFFEGVICFSVIEYMRDQGAAIREMNRVIKQGGLLIISVPHSFSLLRFAQRLRSWLPWWRGGAGYIDVSHFAATPYSLKKILSLNKFVCKKIIKFDPIIPQILYFSIPPSLLFIIADKL